ncbi:transcription-repair coupling factor [bacterium]|nr:transcription-repair coupling factor [bacterium]
MNVDFLKHTAEFKSFVQSLNQRPEGLQVTGLTEAAKPYFLSTLLQETQKKIIFIRPSTYSLSPFEEQCRFFLSLFSSSLKTYTLPPLSENPYQEIFPSLEAVSSRMSFFYELTHNDPRLVVTNLLGLLKPFPHPQYIQDLFLTLEVGTSVERDELLKKLKHFGYTKEDLINSSGEYAWRGGIVDVFSPWSSHPFRIELSGNQIVSLREFDASTQKSQERLDHVLIPSLREHPPLFQFLKEWKEKALHDCPPDCRGDLNKKIRCLEEEDVFPSFSFLSLMNENYFVPFHHYLKDFLLVMDEYEEVKKDWDQTLHDYREQQEELKSQNIFVLPPEKMYPPTLWERIQKKAVFLRPLSPSLQKKSFSFSFQSTPQFNNKIPFFLQYLERLQEERERCFIFFKSPGVRQKLATLLSQHQLRYEEASNPFSVSRDGAVKLLLGNLHHGFSFPDKKIIFFSQEDVFTEEKVLVSRRRVKPFRTHFQDLKAGDYVVHADYGIGIFKGLIKMKVDKSAGEFIEIMYKDGDKLFVPVEDLNLVQKYSHSKSHSPQLHKLGSPQWEKTKAKTKKAIENMTKELLRLYAERKSTKGYKYSPPGEWQSEFEKTFPYEETEDQEKAIREVLVDMESDFPMDRLLCGDVGYGKTEVAMRAAFKAVMDGKQVAVLCPTTVLASQHLQTFRNRIVLFPLRVESLTRLQSKAQQKKIIKDLKKGLVDIIIGTHRLLSRDVQFRDLGLLIIDEEQRFGVNHKEKIKKMKTRIDVLTMSATPIPRTLNFSLSGLRDISLIETPPKDRLAIHTVVTPFSRKLISSAIQTELFRGGQVYFIHNRIEDIDSIAQMIQRWVPESRVITIHGQMSSKELEKRMIDFIDQKYNVLVSTTIIENGIDIPLVNTLIVNRADRFGLAQLYQLRGRVGRSSRQAVAYLLVPPFTELTGTAKERLRALQEFTELGAGFRLAAKDLEIRGAGNFFGSQQHGYIEAVGYDYYMHLLDQTIKEFKGEKTEKVKSEINLKVDIRIPEKYLPQINLRLSLYKRVSSIEELSEIEGIRKEIEDRYGPLPPSVERLLRYGVVKFLAQKLKIKAIDRVGKRVIFKFFPSSSADVQTMTRLIKKRSGSITPQGVLSLYLQREDPTQIMDETISILKELSKCNIMIWNKKR